MRKIVDKVYNELELSSTFQMSISGLENTVPNELNIIRNITKSMFETYDELLQKDLLIIYDAMYRSGLELIDDTKFDTFESIYKKKDGESIGWFEENLKNWNKLSHKISMGSLAKLTTVEKIFEWNERNDVKPHSKLVSEKLDGISLVLNYKNGLLETAVTRGRSGANEGQNITDNAIHFKGIQKKLLDSYECSIRGELVILKDDFIKINSILESNKKPPLKNTRNGVSSIATKYKDRNKDILNLVTFIAYDVKIFD